MLSDGTEVYYLFNLANTSGKAVKTIKYYVKVQLMGCGAGIAFCRLLSLTLINIHDTRLHYISSLSHQYFPTHSQRFKIHSQILIYYQSVSCF